MAIDPSAAFRSAVKDLLPKARVSPLTHDRFQLIKLANDVVTAVRRRSRGTGTTAADGRSTPPGPTGSCCYARTTPSPLGAAQS